MTNKEKYIDKVGAKAAAETLRNVLWNSYAKSEKGDFKDVLYDWLSQEVEKTADEMFNELGYKKVNKWGSACAFDRENGNSLDRIVIDKTNYGYYYIKHRILYNKNFYEEYTQSYTISEDEDKAIHKKIEELRQTLVKCKKAQEQRLYI